MNSLSENLPDLVKDTEMDCVGGCTEGSAGSDGSKWDLLHRDEVTSSPLVSAG